ncbi:MAG: hypothetical protein AB8F34_06620 [Akkermansiaceae bacterium]
MNAQPHREEEAVAGSTATSDHPQPSQFSAVSTDVPIELEHALIRTLAMLQQHNLASAEDCSQVAAKVRRSWEQATGADPVIGLARLRAGGGDMLDASVEMIAIKMAQSLPFAPTRVPFAARLIPPTALYEKHPEIYKLCKLMLVPITFAEDLDVIGIASVNPYFADTVSASLSESLKKETGIQPLIQNIRLDYVGWVKMCQKHFRQDV